MSCSECSGYGVSNCPCCSEDCDNPCPECGSEMEFEDSGSFRGVDWYNLKCPDCGYEQIGEPDYDEYD